MTGQERVNRMFKRQDQDRVPRYDMYWKETIENWHAQGFEGDEQTLLDILDADIHFCCSILPEAFPGRHEVIEEDEQTEVIRNGWGETARHFKYKSTTPEHIGYECETREIWEERFKPAFQKSGVQVDLHQTQKRYAEGRAKGKWCLLHTAEAFAISRHVLGDFVSLIAMADDPQWIRDVAIVITDSAIQSLEAIMETGIQPDSIWMGGDMAFGHSTVCSPDTYRQLLWPQHKRLADWTHQRGMKLIYHTDGNVNGVIDLFLEAGIDAPQPLEVKAGMDVRALVPKYGDQLACFGNIDATVLNTNDLERIEEEIKTKFAAGMARRGYIYHSDHSIPPQVTWPTYQFILEMIDRYGNYMWHGSKQGHLG